MNYHIFSDLVDSSIWVRYYVIYISLIELGDASSYVRTHMYSAFEPRKIAQQFAEYKAAQKYNCVARIPL